MVTPRGTRESTARLVAKIKETEEFLAKCPGAANAEVILEEIGSPETFDCVQVSIVFDGDSSQIVRRWIDNMPNVPDDAEKHYPAWQDQPLRLLSIVDRYEYGLYIPDLIHRAVEQAKNLGKEIPQLIDDIDQALVEATRELQ